jgi:hypothetical protein
MYVCMYVYIPKHRHAQQNLRIHKLLLRLFSLSFKPYWLLDAPTDLTFNNSTFCPHSVFMCFVFISEQTATFALHNIN